MFNVGAFHEWVEFLKYAMENTVSYMEIHFYT